MSTTTTVVTKQVTSASGSVVVTGNRDWNSGLLACFDDMKSCLCGLFCLPCFMCQLSSRLGEHCCAPICVPGSLVALRLKTRLMLGIKGTLLNDCCFTACCPNCVACQMSRELDSAGWPR